MAYFRHDMEFIMSKRPSSKTHLFHMGHAYKKHSVRAVTNDRGELVCPRCGHEGDFQFVHEDIQSGMFFDKYMEFVVCPDCGYGMALIVNRRGGDYEYV